MQQLWLEPIRLAIASGEFELALRLWNDYAEGLAAALNEGRLSGDRLREVGEIVEWTRSVVLATRAHLSAQLNSLRVAEGYEPASSSATHHLLEASI